MEVGVNFNGDRSFEEIKKGVKLSERMGYSNVWVGESIHFSHPFPVIAAITHATDRIRVGSGIISYFFNRSLHIKKAFETLMETYGDRFAVTLAPGDVNSLRQTGLDASHPLERLERAVADLRSSKALENTPLYVGASGPRMIEAAGRIADGVLLNYAHPVYVEWALNHLERKAYVGVYAPALLVPDRLNEKAVLMAAAFVAAGSNPEFQEQFNLRGEVDEVRRILNEKRYDDLWKKRDFLLDRFAIHGDIEKISERLNEFKKMGVDQVILGSPFTYNHEAIKTIAHAL